MPVVLPKRSGIIMVPNPLGAIHKNLVTKFQTELVAVSLPGNDGTAPEVTFHVFLRHAGWVSYRRDLRPYRLVEEAEVVEAHGRGPDRTGTVRVMVGDPRGEEYSVSLRLAPNVPFGKQDDPTKLFHVTCDSGSPVSLPPGDYMIVTTNSALRSLFSEHIIRVKPGAIEDYWIVIKEPLRRVELEVVEESGLPTSAAVSMRDAANRGVLNYVTPDGSAYPMWLPCGVYHYYVQKWGFVPFDDKLVVAESDVTIQLVARLTADTTR